MLSILVIIFNYISILFIVNHIFSFCLDYLGDEGGLKVTSFDEDSCTTNAGSNYMYPNDNCELDAVQPVCGELTSDPYKYMDKMSVQR